jgi:antitoxin component of MazEF toxin-antitoxin module
MIKKITKIGNSNGILFDATLMDMAHLKTGDEVSITLHDGGSITLSPIRPRHTDEEFSNVVREVTRKYAKTLKRLA